MTTGIGPYEVPDPIDTEPSGTVLETTITTSLSTVDIVGGVLANAETYNGNIPGPTLRLNVGDTVIVRLVNNLPYRTGIHWHGIELANSADGTPVTQNGAFGGPGTPPAVPAGGTYLYKFTAPRPGLYWYHPHHFHSTNRVFRGLYGMIIVADPNESALIASGVLPAASDTLPLVLSDTTVCKAAGSKDAVTYDPTLPWVGGGALPVQPAPTPLQLCEIAPAGQAMQEDGTPAVASFSAGVIPNIQKGAAGGRTNEGQIVLTNGVNVGARTGTPAAPGALAPGAFVHPVQAGQGLRLQIVNCATTRYFRLLLTTDGGGQVPLVRVGGEGGLLDNAVVEGGIVGPDSFDTKYTSGEIVLPPATRADVVVAIPDTAVGVLTLWTQDYERTGQGFAQIPTVPVMHMQIGGGPIAPAYTIADSTPLRASIVGQAVETLGASTGNLLDPATFVPGAKPGLASQDIKLQTPPSIDGTQGSFGGFSPYTNAPHIPSSRWAEQGDILELTVTNETNAHHPFHLHGFSFQPLSLAPRVGAPAGTPTETFNWPYSEFRDTVDIPSQYTLTFRVRIEDRELLDGATMGGALGRWLFHCHIFHHAHTGMISEFVTSAADGSEKPYVDVGGSWAYAPAGGTATRNGTFHHPDGDAVTLTAHLADGTPLGTIIPSGSTWSWTLNTMGMPNQIQYVYVTAEDPAGRKGQAVFRLKIGGFDDGSDNGDPHIRTVDGKKYDFQAVGEFTLLRDRDGMEIQTRQTPVATQNPITDSYSGLTACVSVNTAVAALVGTHRIAYQPGAEPGQLQFYLDGKPSDLTTRGIDLDGHRVSAFDADGATGLRVDYAHHAVLVITPRFWTSHNIWYMNVSVSHTHADEGIMGSIPKESWLPTLQNGATVGPMPRSLNDRWLALYKTFADSWRVTDETSLFVYATGTSTATFTDRDWPAAKPPCNMKPQFEIPGAPLLTGMPTAQAEQVCQAVTIDDLHRDCVFDVATTGDETFADGYLFAQGLRLHGTAIQVVIDKPHAPEGEPVRITATVTPLTPGRPIPTGHVTFDIDGAAIVPPAALDANGQATFTTDQLSLGDHRIHAIYVPGGMESAYHPSTSPGIDLTIEEGTGVPGEPEPKPWLKWLWILIILLLLLFFWIMMGL
jgi:FtsP/CotA-like multicopper oxidase with cupredoxin domain